MFSYIYIYVYIYKPQNRNLKDEMIVFLKTIFLSRKLVFIFELLKNTLKKTEKMILLNKVLFLKSN